MLFENVSRLVGGRLTAAPVWRGLRSGGWANNLFAGGTGGGAVFDVLAPTGGNPMLPAAQMHHNGYSRVAPGTPTNLVNWHTARWPTLAAFQLATGREANGLYQETPFFIDAAHGDYRLVPGSPATTAATPLPPDVAAAIGVPPSPVTLGALLWPPDSP